MLIVHTIGHSTRGIEEFLELLRGFGVKRLIDIRTVPGSRFNPQFGQQALQAALQGAGMEYLHLKALGGLRKGTDTGLNTGWRSQSFRGYADYMQTEAFSQGMEELLRLAGGKPSAIMCAEALPWRCHRSLVSDALLIRGVKVLHIMGPGKESPHSLTPFARVDGMTITYPGEAGHG